MKRILYWIRNFFGFSRNETNGFLILIPMMILIIFSNSFYRKFFYNSASIKNDPYIDSLISNWVFNPTIANSDNPETEMFVFNPNTASEEELDALGFPPFLSKRLISYRSKGGKFSKPDDLLRLYGMDTAFYISLEPYIAIPTQAPIEKTVSKKNETRNSTPKPETFDLNLADTTQLKSIYGIGSVLSARIIKFRDKLGGFVSMNQLSNVYGLDSVARNALIHKSFITPNFVPLQIDLNNASEKELASHPFISYKLSKTIVAYRIQHGSFNEIDDLLKIDLIDREVLEKIRPYLIIMP